MEEKPLAKRVGILIRQLRRAAGMSQEAFADHCGLHRTYVGSIERGEKTVTIETANKLARALGLSLSELFRLLEKDESAQNEDRGG
jgi:transcriptional regulator with XRE-family HTH domain